MPSYNATAQRTAVSLHPSLHHQQVPLNPAVFPATRPLPHDAVRISAENAQVSNAVVNHVSCDPTMDAMPSEVRSTMYAGSTINLHGGRSNIYCVLWFGFVKLIR